MQYKHRKRLRPRPRNTSPPRSSCRPSSRLQSCTCPSHTTHTRPRSGRWLPRYTHRPQLPRSPPPRPRSRDSLDTPPSQSHQQFQSTYSLHNQYSSRSRSRSCTSPRHTEHRHSRSRSHPHYTGIRPSERPRLRLQHTRDTQYHRHQACKYLSHMTCNWWWQSHP